MAVPAQVRRQAEVVSQLMADLNAETTPVDSSEQAEPKAKNDNTATPAAAEPVTGNSTEEDFEHKYRTLQGLYNSHVPQLQQKAAQYENRITQLEQLLSNIQTKQPAAQPAASAPTRLVTDEDIEEFGDSLDVMRRVSREENAAYLQEIASLKETINKFQSVLPRVEQLSTQQAKSAEGQFWQTLTDRVPNWQDINNNQDFQSWLLEADALTGMTRQSFLEGAQSKLDAAKVAQFFTTREATRTTPAVPNPQRKPSSELERQVAPGKGKTAGSGQPSEPKTYTQSDIKKFYADVATGKYKTREEERSRIERDIFVAQNEDRIVSG
jgi:hypothetical protein